MNAKTAKLINRYAGVMQRQPRGVRRIYNRLPQTKRHETKEEMRAVIADHA